MVIVYRFYAGQGGVAGMCLGFIFLMRFWAAPGALWPASGVSWTVDLVVFFYVAFPLILPIVQRVEPIS